MNKAKHTLFIDGRSFLKVTAVEEVISFDETLVCLSLGDTVLELGGDGLSIKNLSLENGEVAVSGNISSAVYCDGTPKRKRLSLFGR